MGAFEMFTRGNDSSEEPPTPVPPPVFGESGIDTRNVGYALQWFVFAIMGFVGFGWALRREARGDAELDEQPREPRRRRRQTDADVEDAILDGAER